MKYLIGGLVGVLTLYSIGSTYYIYSTYKGGNFRCGR